MAMEQFPDHIERQNPIQRFSNWVLEHTVDRKPEPNFVTDRATLDGLTRSEVEMLNNFPVGQSSIRTVYRQPLRKSSF